MSKYIKLVQENRGDNTISFKLDDNYYMYDFYINDGNDIEEDKNHLSLQMTDADAKYHYNVLSLVLMFGEKYWHNLCLCGGSSILSTRFTKFINNNIMSIERNIKIEKIIE